MPGQMQRPGRGAGKLGIAQGRHVEVGWAVHVPCATHQVTIVKRNQISEIIGILALAAILMSEGFSWGVPECQAQSRMARAEYDYHAFAITSVLNSAREASKLPDVPQRVKLLLYAAKILAPSRRDEAKQLLDLALSDVNKWGSADKARWYQRHTAANLRNEVLAVYARVDPEKTIALQKEFRTAANSSAIDSSYSLCSR